MELGLQEVDNMDYNFNDRNTRKDDYYVGIGKNIEKLKSATEVFTALMHYIFLYKEFKSFKLKVGTFEYNNDWTCKLYCYMEDDEVYFTEEENSIGLNIQKKYKRLTDLCFGDDFSMSEINIDYKPINEFLNLLDDTEKDDFAEILAETHCEFW